MDVPFRIVLVLVFACSMAIAVSHRLQAAKSGERFDRRQEGMTLAIVLRLAGLLVWLGVLAWLVYPPAVAWAQVALPDSVRWLGAAGGALGIAMMYWTLTNLGKNLTDTVATRAEATLVTTGPYRYVRHPFYLTAAILFFSAALLSANVLIALGGLVVMFLLVARTSKEEAMLRAKFGVAYDEYCRRTGRFLPRIFLPR